MGSPRHIEAVGGLAEFHEYDIENVAPWQQSPAFTQGVATIVTNTMKEVLPGLLIDLLPQKSNNKSRGNRNAGDQPAPKKPVRDVALGKMGLEMSINARPSLSYSQPPCKLQYLRYNDGVVLAAAVGDLGVVVCRKPPAKAVKDFMKLYYRHQFMPMFLKNIKVCSWSPSSRRTPKSFIINNLLHSLL